MKYLLILLMAIPLPVAGYQYVMHRRAAFAVPDYTQDANCIAAYYFNGIGSGSETDRSTNGYDLTANGTISSSSSKPDGYEGVSRNLESANSEYFENTSFDIVGADQEISVACWVRYVTTNTSMVLCSQYLATGDQKSWRLVNNSSEETVFALSDDGLATTDVRATTSFPTNQWNHLAVTYDDIQMILYTNAVPLATNAYTGGIFDSTANFKVGANNNVSTYLNGRIDELIVFDRAITAAEVLNIYTYGVDGANGGND